jgi:hypothetical protein
MVITPTLLSRSCILCRGVGTIDYDAFIALFEALFRLQGPLAGVNLLGDLRGCHSTLDFRSAFQISEYIRGELPLFSGSRWAFLTDSPLIYGLARMGQIITSDYPFQCAVFDAAEPAMTWLQCADLLRPALEATDASSA